MELTPESNGNHLIFCGGTGIYPFLDLLDFLLKKSIYSALCKNFSKEIAEQTNLNHESYDKIFGPKFKIYLYASFQTEIEFMNICDFVWKLYKINEKFNLGLFDMVLRFSKKIKIEGVKIIESYFDESFFDQYITQQQISKVLVCGNPQMNKTISEICLKKLISQDAIYLV